jgi:hypothetical protein
MPVKLKSLILNHLRVENKERILHWFHSHYVLTPISENNIIKFNDIYHHYKSTQLELKDQKYLRYRNFIFCFPNTITSIKKRTIVVKNYKRKTMPLEIPNEQ